MYITKPTEYPPLYSSGKIAGTPPEAGNLVQG